TLQTPTLGPPDVSQTSSPDGITSIAQHKVLRRTGRIDGPVEVVPQLLDVDVGSSYSAGIIGDFELLPTPLVQLCRIALDPVTHGGVVDLQTPFLQEFFHIAIARRIMQVPADTALGSLRQQSGAM